MDNLQEIELTRTLGDYSVTAKTIMLSPHDSMIWDTPMIIRYITDTGRVVTSQNFKSVDDLKRRLQFGRK